LLLLLLWERMCDGPARLQYYRHPIPSRRSFPPKPDSMAVAIGAAWCLAIGASSPPPPQHYYYCLSARPAAGEERGGLRCASRENLLLLLLLLPRALFVVDRDLA
jgi:hypothetical protein